MIDNVKSGFPSHCMKEVRNIILDLIKEGVLSTKKSKHGLAVSLNIKRKNEIEEMIGREPFFSP